MPQNPKLASNVIELAAFKKDKKLAKLVQNIRIPLLPVPELHNILSIPPMPVFSYPEMSYAALNHSTLFSGACRITIDPYIPTPDYSTYLKKELNSTVGNHEQAIRSGLYNQEPDGKGFTMPGRKK